MDISSVVSSESEEEKEEGELPPPPPPPQQENKKKNKNKKKKEKKTATPQKPVKVTTHREEGEVESSDDDDDDEEEEEERCTIVPKSQEEQKTNNKKRKQRKSTDIFAKPKNKSQPAPSSSSSSSTLSPPPLRKKQKKGEKTTKVGSASKNTTTTATTTSFRNLNLPIASFVTPKSASSLKKATPSKNKKQQNKTKEKDDDDEEEPPKPDLPLPTSTKEGREWLDAVIKTRQHKKYATSYDFRKDQLESTATWIKARPFGDWCRNHPQSIAVDCEMCETKDPLTGTVNHKALCRVSIVNAAKPDEVLLDTLVKPDWPVTDYRTWVNGIEQDHLREVQFTLRHAQAFLMALCSDQTVLVGHALHNDLRALQMDHSCNADSALLFSVKDEPGATISLKDLTMGVLQTDMPNIHDSVNDARMALLCLRKYLQQGGRVEPVPRSFPPKNSSAASSRNPNASRQLFVHRIPKALVAMEQLEDLFLNQTHIRVESVNELEFGNDYGKTLVTFSSTRHANLAFHVLSEKAETDKSGRTQKRVYLRNGSFLWIRKMVHDRKKADGTQKEPPSEEDKE